MITRGPRGHGGSNVSRAGLMAVTFALVFGSGASRLSAAPPASPGPSTSTAAAGPARSSVAPLPKPPSLDLPPPEPPVAEALDRHLARLAGRDPAEREAAVQEILEIEVDVLPAIHRRLAAIAEAADREGMKAVLGATRDHARERSRT